MSLDFERFKKGDFRKHKLKIVYNEIVNFLTKRNVSRILSDTSILCFQYRQYCGILFLRHVFDDVPILQYAFA